MTGSAGQHPAECSPDCASESFQLRPRAGRVSSIVAQICVVPLAARASYRTTGSEDAELVQFEQSPGAGEAITCDGDGVGSFLGLDRVVRAWLRVFGLVPAPA